MRSYFFQSLMESYADKATKIGKYILGQAADPGTRLRHVAPAIAGHYGLDYAGEKVDKAIKKKLPRVHRVISRPKTRVGRTVSDIGSLVGATLAFRSGKSLRQKFGRGIAGLIAANLSGKEVGKRVERRLFRRKRK